MNQHQPNNKKCGAFGCQPNSVGEKCTLHPCTCRPQHTEDGTCDHCKGVGCEKCDARFLLSPATEEKHDRKVCDEMVHRGKNICDGIIRFAKSEFCKAFEIECGCKCHASPADTEGWACRKEEGGL